MNDTHSTNTSAPRRGGLVGALMIVAGLALGALNAQVPPPLVMLVAAGATIGALLPTASAA